MALPHVAVAESQRRVDGLPPHGGFPNHAGDILARAQLTDRWRINSYETNC